MTKNERIAMWLLVAGLVVFAYGVSLRIDTLTNDGRRFAATAHAAPVTSTTATTSPLEAAVAGLRADVRELQATRGLSGPEVRALVETLLPAPGCVEPPCDGGAATPTTTLNQSSTTVKR